MTRALPCFVRFPPSAPRDLVSRPALVQPLQALTERKPRLCGRVSTDRSGFPLSGRQCLQRLASHGFVSRPTPRARRSILTLVAATS